MSKSKKTDKDACKNCGAKRIIDGVCQACGVKVAGKNSEKLPDDAKGDNPS